MDYNPGHLDDVENFPKAIYCSWDYCCEFMDATDDEKHGEGWVESAKSGHGYAAKYVLVEATPQGREE